jgi:release factor glutamine methyltransferase
MTIETAIQIDGQAQTVGALVTDIRCRLKAAGIESADQEASWLIEHALGLSGLRQTVDHKLVLSEKAVADVQALASRREAREPLQYLVGTQEFCGLEFEVNPSVLIPRPETELLVHETFRRLQQRKGSVLVDVGTGSGCLAVMLARSVPDGKVVAIDLSARALEIAKRNARRHKVETAITWLEGDLLAPLTGLGFEGTANAIISNPPYIRESDWPGLQPEVCRYEPRTALVAGPRGTELHERLLHEAMPYLRPGGFLAMELGQGQSEELRAMVANMAVYRSPEVVLDEAGIDRVLIVERAG